jgi:hypothetical protein
VWFATAAAAGSLPTAGDLLVAAPALVLPGGEVADAGASDVSSTSTAATGSAQVSQASAGPVSGTGSTLEEEWLRNQPPLI